MRRSLTVYKHSARASMTYACAAWYDRPQSFTHLKTTPYNLRSERSAFDTDDDAGIDPDFKPTGVARTISKDSHLRPLIKALKSTQNKSLCRIAGAYKTISGIVCRKNSSSSRSQCTSDADFEVVTLGYGHIFIASEFRASAGSIAENARRLTGRRPRTCFCTAPRFMNNGGSSRGSITTGTSYCQLMAMKQLRLRGFVFRWNTWNGRMSTWSTLLWRKRRPSFVRLQSCVVVDLVDGTLGLVD
jgi:hypothetical protein